MKNKPEDLSVEIQQKIRQAQADYDTHSVEMFRYLNELFNSTINEFKVSKRMDKLQELQMLAMSFVDRVIAEKNTLNYQFVNTELKMDPTLGPKLEHFLGKKIPTTPNDQGQGGIKFNRG